VRIAVLRASEALEALPWNTRNKEATTRVTRHLQASG